MESSTPKNQQQNQSKKRRPRRRKAANKQPTNTVRVPLQARQRSAIFHLSPCSDTYLRCLTNPFDKTITDACVPDLDATPSVKIRTLTRGGLTVGSGGCGWIILNPLFPFSDDHAIHLTTSANTITTGSGFANDPARTSANISGFPFTWSQTVAQRSTVVPNPLGYGISYRPVGAGLRIRYTGADLWRSGRVIPVRAPQSGSLFLMNTAQVLSIQEIEPQTMNKSWHEINFLPSSGGGVSDWSGATGPFFQAIDTYSYCPGMRSSAGLDASFGFQGSVGIIVEGVALGPSIPQATFEWEAVVYYEVVGPVINSTPSHSDLTGMTMLRNIVGSTLLPGEGGINTYNKASSEIKKDVDWVSYVAPLLEYYGKPALEKAAPKLIEYGKTFL